MEGSSKLTSWTLFSEFKSIDGRDKPGVYLLAHFARKPSSAPCPTSNNIIYIGETTAQTIHKRLYQFSNSAFKRKRGHSGGRSYSDTFLGGRAVTLPPDNLYVSMLPVSKPAKESKAYIKYVERHMIWEFFKKNKDYPVCNTT